MSFTMKSARILLLFEIMFLADVFSVRIENVFVVQDSSLPLTSDKFLSVALDTGLIKKHLRRFDIRSPRLLTLASALKPSYLRLGGTAADCLFFNKNESAFTKGSNTTSTDNFYDDIDEGVKADINNFTMSHEEWDKMNLFTSEVQWDLIFDLNVLLRKNGHWDPQNATAILKYSTEKKFKISGFELGNEPNSFRHVFGREVTSFQLQEDFHTLKNLLQSFPMYNQSLLIGPDTTQLLKKGPTSYFESFLKDGGVKVVNKATFHHYYIGQLNATVDKFTDPAILDTLRLELIKGKNITQSLTPRRDLWLGETASAYGGGASGLSDRYVAGFMWLDKLGLCAQYGVDVVIRQTFLEGNYALVDVKNYHPNPDYWLSLLFKILVGRRVLNVKVKEPKGRFRVYAHCTNTIRSNYPTGSLTLYALNLFDETVLMNLPDYSNQALHIYWLEPGDGDGLTSSWVRLNGKVLIMKSDTELPEMLPRKQMKQPIEIPPKTFGFIVVPDAKLTVCQ